MYGRTGYAQDDYHGASEMFREVLDSVNRTNRGADDLIRAMSNLAFVLDEQVSVWNGSSLSGRREEYRCTDLSGMPYIVKPAFSRAK